MKTRKPKLLFLYAGIKPQVFPLAKAMEEYYEVNVCYSLLGRKYELAYDSELPELTEVKIENVNPHHYDFAFGFDPGCLVALSSFVTISNKPAGCNILDVPAYTYLRNRNYHPSLEKLWKHWMKHLGCMSFFTSYKQVALEHTMLEKAKERIPFKLLFAPIEPIPKPEEYEEKKQLVFSGRIIPDKGLHNIMDVMSLVCPKHELLAIGHGEKNEDLTAYAKYLRMNYRQISGCSQKDKFKHYYESAGILSCGDNGDNISYPPLEAISIGRPAVVNDWPEARRCYGDHVFYAEPFNPMAYADALYTLLTDEELVNKKLKGAKEFCAQYTNAEWARQFHEFLTDIGVFNA